jgi:hypothetical protein
LEEAEDAMLGVFSEMSHTYLFTTGFDSRIIEARDAIRALKRLDAALTQMTWTHFHDMHSGGGQKLDWGHIFIEAPKAEAEIIFQNRFKRNPNRVTCTCCGPDYSISEDETLEQATAYERGCAYVYRDADGNEIDEREGWIPGKGHAKGVTAKYEERGGGRFQFRTYQPLEDYLAAEKVKVIRAKEIRPKDREGELHEEGYVWRE